MLFIGRIKILVYFIAILLRVAFITLFERKFLSYTQLRQGPVKTGYKGLFQPFRDAIKLFKKELLIPYKRFPGWFLFAPVLSLGLILVLWLSSPSLIRFGDIELGVIYIMCCLRVGVYYTFCAGWSSNCKYSSLGGIRAIAQTISYEVSFFLIILSFIILLGEYNIISLTRFSGIWFVWLSPVLCGIWFISCLAETNRTPFDFREGESELVSGFNTEYSSGPFALFFLREYGFILFMSIIFSLLFFGGVRPLVSNLIKFIFFVFLFIWVRATLPRLRYDKLIFLAWEIFLPISLAYLIFFTGLRYFLAG